MDIKEDNHKFFSLFQQKIKNQSDRDTMEFHLFFYNISIISRPYTNMFDFLEMFVANNKPGFDLHEEAHQ